MRKDQKCRGITREARKMAKGLKKMAFGLVAVGLCFALLLTAAIPVCEAEPDKKVVKIGHRAVFTGGYASTTLPACQGFNDGIRDVNDRGGINGIKIELLWEDVRGVMPLAISAHRRFVGAGIIAEVAPDTVSTEALAPAQQRDEVPMLYMAGMTRLMITQPMRWVFSLLFPMESEATHFMKWAKENWTETRPPRLGLFMFDHSGGWVSLEAIRELADEMGVEFVGYEVVPAFGAIDTSVEWLRLAGKKPDWVYVVCCGASLVTSVKDFARLGLWERGIKPCSWAAGIDEFIVRATGASANGWYISKAHPSTMETELPGVNVAVELAKRYHGWGLEDMSGHYMAGIVLARITAEVIRLAIEEVGYENVTGRAVRDAVVTLKDFDTGILPYSIIGPTEDDPYFITWLRYYQVQQERIVPISERFEFDRSLDYKELGGKL